MEKSVHLEQKKSAKAAAWIFQIAAAFLLTMGTVGMMLDLTGNMWAASDMFSGSYTGGAIRLWDDFANVMGTVSYTLLPKYMGADDYSGLFVTVMALLIYVLPAALLPLITDIGPMQETVMFLAAGIIMALINIRFEGKASLTGLVPVVLVCVITAFTANTAAVSQSRAGHSGDLACAGQCGPAARLCPAPVDRCGALYSILSQRRRFYFL